MRVANCSHQRAPKLGRIQQVTEFHYLVCHVLCHCSSSLPEQANQQHTLTLCWVPPSSEFTVLLHQSSGNTVLMSPCTQCWSSSSDQDILWGYTSTRSHFALLPPQHLKEVAHLSPFFFLSHVLCIYFFILAFIWIASPMRFMIYHVVIKLRCQHRERSDLGQWEVGG